MAQQIDRIGFFHFVKDDDQPIPSLKVELKKYHPSEIDGSLIVLPETFNLGRCYRDSIPGQFIAATPFLNDLADLSRRAGAVFVVSVLEATPMCRLPYNSAYLVTPDNGKAPVLMSRKMDPSGLYQAVDQPAGENPLEYGGICVATAVCAGLHPLLRREPFRCDQGQPSAAQGPVYSCLYGLNY